MIDRAPPKQTCTDHCAGCDRHFHGLQAFDAHRQDSECQEPDGLMGTKGQPLLQAWTMEGYCALSNLRAPLVHPVTIWQTYRTEEQRQRLATAFTVKQEPLL